MAAEILGIVASVASLLALTQQIVELGAKSLSALKPTRQTPAQLQSLHQEIEALTAILQSLHDVISQCPAAVPAIAGLRTCNLQLILSDALEPLHDAEKLFNQYALDFASEPTWSRPFVRITWASKERKIETLLKQVERFKGTVDFALHAALFVRTNLIHDTTQRTQEVAVNLAGEMQTFGDLLRQMAACVVGEPAAKVAEHEKVARPPHMEEAYFSEVETTLRAMSVRSVSTVPGEDTLPANTELKSVVNSMQLPTLPGSSIHRPARTQAAHQLEPKPHEDQPLSKRPSPTSPIDRPSLSREQFEESIEFANIYAREEQWEDAASFYEELFQMSRRVNGPHDTTTFKLMIMMGICYHQQGHWTQAEIVLMQFFEEQTRVLGPEHPDTLTAVDLMAAVFYSQKKWADAEYWYAKLYAAQKRSNGLEHEDTLTTMAMLSNTYCLQGRYDDAEQLNVQRYEIRRRVNGPDHDDTVVVMKVLSVVYEKQGRLAETEKVLKDICDAQRRVHGVGDLETLNSTMFLANWYSKQERFADSRRVMKQVLKVRERVQGVDHADTLACKQALSDVLLSQKKGRKLR